MSIKRQLRADLKEAMRARDRTRKAVIRLTLSAITNAEVERRRDLDDAEAIAVLQKEARKRQETIEELRGVDRPEQLADEEAELGILQQYLPRMMERDEIELCARQVIAEVGASTMAQMGQVMRTLMSELRGRADGRIVNQVVRELLSG